MLDDRRQAGRGSPVPLDIVSDLGDNKAVGGGFIGAVPASFATQMGYASNGMRARATNGQDGSDDDQRMMSRLMLARMNNMEEGFREVLKEVKEWRKGDAASTGDDRRAPKGVRKVDKRSKQEGKVKEVTMGEADGKGKEAGNWVDDNQEQARERGSSI